MASSVHRYIQDTYSVDNTRRRITHDADAIANGCTNKHVMDIDILCRRSRIRVADLQNVSVILIRWICHRSLFEPKILDFDTLCAVRHLYNAPPLRGNGVTCALCHKSSGEHSFAREHEIMAHHCNRVLKRTR